MNPEVEATMKEDAKESLSALVDGELPEAMASRCIDGLITVFSISSVSSSRSWVA